MEQADCDRKSNEFLPGTSRAPFCRSRNTRVSDRLPTARRRYGPTAAAYSCGAPRALPADLQAIIDRGRGEVRLRRTYRDQSAGLAATAGGNPRSGEPIHCKLVPISGLPATKQGLGTHARAVCWEHGHRCSRNPPSKAPDGPGRRRAARTVRFPQSHCRSTRERSGHLEHGQFQSVRRTAAERSRRYRR